ncbi:L-lactate permease [Alphaproteobacteria bacterium]|nr:L-lactate permease [Alphaproteobacteria bacterium]
MYVWVQNYNPAGNLWISFAAAATPVIFLFVSMIFLRMKGHVVGTVLVLLALANAIFFYDMPASPALSAGLFGFFYGLWPIAWVIVAAVFFYKLMIKTDQFDVIRSSLSPITRDRRLQMLLVTIPFGGFLEGALGFGAPVAITAAFLIGLRFKPLYAAGLCLIANTAPVSFGAISIPITVASKLTGIDTFLLGQMAGRQLPFLAFAMPFLLVAIMDGARGLKETWPAILTAAVSFSTVMFLTSNFIGPELTDILSSLASLACLLLLLKVWRPRTIFRFAWDDDDEKEDVHRFSRPRILQAWSPFFFLTAAVSLWSTEQLRGLLGRASVEIPIPGLHKLIMETYPISATNEVIPALYKFDLLLTPGSAIMLAAIVSMVFLKVAPGAGLKIFEESLKHTFRSLYTISMMLTFAFIVNYSGQTATIALLLTKSGPLFPFFSPVLGWFGVFITGSDTASTGLFCELQAVVAHQVGAPELLMIVSNSTGGVTAKMISPQNIAIAAAAVGLAGRESHLLRFTLRYSLPLLLFMGGLTTAQTYLFPWMIP